MNLLNEIVQELDTYSTCSIMQYEPKIKAAYINIGRFTFALFDRKGVIHMSNVLGSNDVNYVFNQQTKEYIVEKLISTFL